MKENTIVPIINLEKIKNSIYEIRGQKVIFDFDIADLFGFETRRLNERIKRNIKKFPDGSVLQLSKEEFDTFTQNHVIDKNTNFATSRLNFATSSWGGVRKLPYMLTSYGISILTEVLKLNDDNSKKILNIIIELFKNSNTIIDKSLDDGIKSKIYFIRNEKVMLDFELAEIYGYETKRFNEQINNNIDRFPERYRFELTKEETEKILRSKISTAKSLSRSRVLPYVFTEQGIYMLMTVLKGELATKQSIMLIDTFKQMKDYIVENRPLLDINEVIKLTNKVNDNSLRLDNVENKLEVVMDNFIDPTMYKHFVILNGEKIEADLAFENLYKKAKYSIMIIDDYIDIKTLQLLKSSNNVKITIITDNKAKNCINKNYIKDSGLNITFIKNKEMFHDRYIIIDYKTKKEIIFHSGSSLKDSGNSITAINKVEDGIVYHPSIDLVLKSPILEIKE